MNPYPLSYLSLGAGVNSTGMLIYLLTQTQWRGPIVHSDTGCELPETYQFLEHLRPWVQQHGLDILTLPRKYYSQRVQASATLYHYAWDNAMLPLRTARWCTTEYKIRPLKRYMLDMHLHAALIGISTDEAHRANHERYWLQYPLLNAGLSRTDCLTLIAEQSLPKPHHSHCWLCPLMALPEWRHIYDHHPHLFERSIELEDHVSQVHNKQAILAPSGTRDLRTLAARFAAEDLAPRQCTML